MKNLSRREFIKLSGTVAAAGLLTGCGGGATPTHGPPNSSKRNDGNGHESAPNVNNAGDDRPPKRHDTQPRERLWSRH